MAFNGETFAFLFYLDLDLLANISVISFQK